MKNSENSGLTQEEFGKQLGNFREGLEGLRSEYEKKDTGHYTESDENIWQFCKDRWHYYDNLKGSYSGDEHTKDIFNDAAEQFEITASQAELIWDNVDKAKVGLR